MCPFFSHTSTTRLQRHAFLTGLCLCGRLELYICSGLKLPFASCFFFRYHGGIQLRQISDDKNMTAICCHLRLMVKPQVPCQWWLAPELKPKLGSTGCFSTTSENAVENGRFHLSLWSFRAFLCWSWSLDFVLIRSWRDRNIGEKNEYEKNTFILYPS